MHFFNILTFLKAFISKRADYTIIIKIVNIKKFVIIKRNEK